MLFECDSRCFGSLHLSALTICCIVWKVLRPSASTLLEPNDDNIHRWNDYYFSADFTPVKSTKPASSIGPQSCFPLCSPITYSRTRTRTSYNFEQHYQPPINGNTIEAGPQGFEGLFSLLRVTTGTSRLDLCLRSSIRQKFKSRPPFVPRRFRTIAGMLVNVYH